MEGVTRVVVRALLDADKGVRSAGAGLGWSVVGRVWASRAEESVEVGGEEWDVEVASAVVEALGRESESVDVGELSSCLFSRDFADLAHSALVQSIA